MGARVAVWWGFVLPLGLLWLTAPGSASAVQLLQNGGFEQGLSGWSGAALASSLCPPRSGSGAAGLVIAGGQTVLLMQTIDGIPAAGAYRLEGYIRRLDGNATITVALVWLNAAGAEISPTRRTLTHGSGYSAFALDETASPSDARGLLVRFTATAAAGATVCLDDLRLEGPPAARETPATATLTSGPTATRTPPATSTAAPVTPPPAGGGVAPPSLPPAAAGPTMAPAAPTSAPPATTATLAAATAAIAPSPFAAVAAVALTPFPSPAPRPALDDKPRDAVGGGLNLPAGAMLLAGSLLAIGGFSGAYVYHRRRRR